MGLDMYLERCKNVVFPYVNKDIEELKESEKEDDKRLLEFLKPYIRKRGKYVQWDSISENVAYWRKANQIHKWFVENVQGGEDDCGTYPVSKEDLKALLAACRLIENGVEMAEKVLPTQSGFFFGSTEYDEWYYEDIKSTIEQLEKVIEETDWETETVYYQASW